MFGCVLVESLCPLDDLLVNKLVKYEIVSGMCRSHVRREVVLRLFTQTCLDDASMFTSFGILTRFNPLLVAII